MNIIKSTLIISIIAQTLVTHLILPEKVWCAAKARRSDSSLELSQKKLIHRYEELGIKDKGLSSQTPTNNNPQPSTPSIQIPSTYDEYIVDMRRRLSQQASPKEDPTLAQDIQKFYLTPPQRVYTDAAQFITQHVQCSDQALKGDLTGSPKKQEKLTSLLQEVDQLSSTQKSLKDEMGSQSIKNGSKELQKLQDTNRIGNIPHPKFSVTREDRPLTVLRMGTQTIDIPKDERPSGHRQAQIAPEFAAFIQGLTRPAQNQQHVYVNLQMTVNPGGILGLFGNGFGDFKKERPRAEALHSFSKSRGNELVVISLDKNSHFYQFFPPTGHSENVIQVLADRFFPSSDDVEKHWLRTGINLSDLWNKDTGHCTKNAHGFPNPKECKTLLRQKFMRDMQKISDDFFGTKANLNRSQSKTFVDLAYQYIINLATQKATTMNMSCKSGVDRAGGVNANFYLLSLIKEICNSSESDSDAIDQKIRDLKYVFFEDAVLYNGRPVNDDRLKRFQGSARTMIQGALHHIQNHSTCMDQSGELLFSGKSLSHALSKEEQSPLGCKSPAQYSSCSSTTLNPGVSPSADQLTDHLLQLRHYPIKSSPFKRSSDPAWIPLLEEEED